MSPIQVQYILDTLDMAQGRLAEVKFKIRIECYSSLYLSFVIADIMYKYSDMFVKGKLSTLHLALFIFYQGRYIVHNRSQMSFHIHMFCACNNWHVPVSGFGIILGYIIARAVQWPIQMAANSPPLCVAIAFSAVLMITSWCIVLGTSSVLAVGVFGILCSALVIRYCLPSVDFYRQVPIVITTNGKQLV